MIGNAVFVARQAALARLDALLDRTLEGQGQVCFVAGEAGAGKSPSPENRRTVLLSAIFRPSREGRVERFAWYST